MTEDQVTTPPFVWPEPRVLDGQISYSTHPPFQHLVFGATGLWGITTGVTERGIRILERWIEHSRDLQVRLIVALYPACGAEQADLQTLAHLAQSHAARVAIRLCALPGVTDRATNVLCVLRQQSASRASGESASSKNSDAQQNEAYLITGCQEDLFSAPLYAEVQTGIVFQPDHALLERIRGSFDWLWVNRSCDVRSRRAALIPELVLPKGSEEAAVRWQAWSEDLLHHAPLQEELDVGLQQLKTEVDPATGAVNVLSPGGEPVAGPSEGAGLPKFDPLAERVARLYAKGSLVSIDKTSRMPPLDAPIDPVLFGDRAEKRHGIVTRKVTMRASILDDKELKQIENRRKGMRQLLERFSFRLADNMRWMPNAVRPLFEKEIERLNAEGKDLISSLVKNDVPTFVKNRAEKVAGDINALYRELGRTGEVPADAVQSVMKDLEGRFTKALAMDLLPTVSYSQVAFQGTETKLSSPWGQAYSLLSDLAEFPRKAQRDPFFLRGIKPPQRELMEAMDAAGDALFSGGQQSLFSFDIPDRCDADLEVLKQIEDHTSLSGRSRCELVYMVLDGKPREAIQKAIATAAKEAEEEKGQ